MTVKTNSVVEHADVVLKARDGSVDANLAVTGNSKRQSTTTDGYLQTRG